MSNEKKVPKGYHWRYVIEKPDPFKPVKTVNQFCQYFDPQKRDRCLAETGGKTYCEKCEERRNKGPVGRRYMQYWRVG